MRDIVKDAIIAMSERNGGTLSPKQLVDAARNPDHPAHPEFDWDNRKAGEKWRLQQAAKLISAVRVEVPSRDILVRPYRVPVFIKHPEAPGYLTSGKAREDEQLSRAAAAQYFAKAGQALRKAQAIAIQLGFGDEVEETLRRITGLQCRLHGGDESGEEEARPAPH